MKTYKVALARTVTYVNFIDVTAENSADAYKIAEELIQDHEWIENHRTTVHAETEVNSIEAK